MKDKPTRKVAYFIWANPYMVAANNTFINEMLQLNKFENIYATKERYPKVDISRIRYEGDPKVVILSSEPYKFKDEHAMEIATYTNRSATVFGDGENRKVLESIIKSEHLNDMIEMSGKIAHNDLFALYAKRNVSVV